MNFGFKIQKKNHLYLFTLINVADDFFFYVNSNGRWQARNKMSLISIIAEKNVTFIFFIEHKKVNFEFWFSKSIFFLWIWFRTGIVFLFSFHLLLLQISLFASAFIWFFFSIRFYFSRLVIHHHRHPYTHQNKHIK